jgi:hypothetical protein
MAEAVKTLPSWRCPEGIEGYGYSETAVENGNVF